jgi:tetratricopeptide (TPR) repeat protein
MPARRARVAGALLLAAAVPAVAGVARAADPEARAAATASCARAEEAAKALHFAEALAAYQAAIAADPSAPCASVARARAADLAVHAEGGFVPLARVEALRRDPRKSKDRAEVEALARDLEAFPEGRVRAEARLLVAEAWWHALGEPERAIAALETTAADAAGDKLTRGLALSELWSLRRQRGEVREALAVMERDPTLAPALLALVRRAAVREHLRTGAIGVLGLLGAIGAASLARLAARARDVRDVPAQVLRPLAVAFALYLGGAGAVLVRVHGGGDARPFLWLGLGVLAILVVARALRLAVTSRGGRGAAARAAWALACVAGVLAAAFLAVERTDATYLEGLGL